MNLIRIDYHDIRFAKPSRRMGRNMLLGRDSTVEVSWLCFCGLFRAVAADVSHCGMSRLKQARIRVGCVKSAAK